MTATTSSASPRLCRLCDESNERMHSVFEKNVFNIQIINLIKDCLPIHIYRKDPLSKYICQSCNETLNMFCEFKRSCIETSKKHIEQMRGGSPDDAAELYLREISEETFNGSAPFENDTETQDSRDFSQSLISENSITCATDDTTQNSESDMEIDQPIHTSIIHEKINGHDVSFGPPIINKPRISGPKSVTNTYTKLIETHEIAYQPLTLLHLIVRAINLQNIDTGDYSELGYREEIRTLNKINYYCRYCDEMFEDERKLAVHEAETHIRLNLERVDHTSVWPENRDDHDVRNKWFEQIRKEEEDVDVEGVEENELLVPIVEDAPPPNPVPTVDTSRNGVIYFVGNEPYAYGVRLKDTPKDVRKTYYPFVRVSGQKRKLCQLCRYTFKDNWGIDMHYLAENCRYTCNYCGLRYKRQKQDFAAHVKEHERLGHEKSTQVFHMNDRGDIIAKDASCVEPFIPPTPTPTSATAAVSKPSASKPSVSTPSVSTTLPDPTPMKLRLRHIAPKIEIPPEKPVAKPALLVTIKKEPGLPPPEDKKKVSNDELAKNQAYFCKKCYEVFTKLDNYNAHTKSCNGEIFDPEMTLIRHYTKKDGSSPVFSAKARQPLNRVSVVPAKKPPPPLKPIAPSGDGGGQSLRVKQEVDLLQKPGDFPCNFCPAVFQTIYSRNSHMRIHQDVLSSKKAPSAKRTSDSHSAAPLAKRAKHEPSFEPIVEIHEGPSVKMPSNIGSVSITPLNRKSLSVSADILKIVKNNPNITLKARNDVSPSSNATANRRPNPPPGSPSPVSKEDELDPSRAYKCAFCNMLFANKSNLYFHKKNTCNGSRYPCPFCKKRFGTASEYSSHIFYSHPD